MEQALQARARAAAVQPTAGQPATKPPVAEPPAVFPLALPALRKHVLERNLGLAVELFDPAIAEQEHRAEAARFEALLGATLGHASGPGPEGEQLTTSSVAPSLHLPLRLGTTLSLDLGYLRTEGAPGAQPGGEPPGSLHAPSWGLSVSQPLLRGGGTASSASERQAGLRVRIAEARAKLAVVRALAGAERTYWEYYCAHEGLGLQLELHELARQQETSARRLVDEGVRTEVEIARARAGVARRLEAILLAETRRRLAELSLKGMIRLEELPLGSPTAIRPDSQPRPRPLVLGREAVIRLALTQRMELFESQVQEAIDAVAVDIRRNDALPELTLDFDYSFSAARPRFTEALEQLARAASPAWSGGLTFALPLGGAAEGQLQAAMLARAKTAAGRQLLEQAVTEEVLGAIDAVEQSWQRIAANRLAVSLAEQAYGAEQVQFQQGFVTGNEVMLALSALAEARFAELEATCDHQKSWVDLAYATGTVAGEVGVSWVQAGVR
ncbi:MAG: TolC family protein [Deltaproteobacteria bacterium]|nr:TolC family protein [Deltaproteobacteria bacterium]